MTKLLYLTDSYKKECTATVVSCDKKGDHWEVVLNETVFYPEGGGQPSDHGSITTKNGLARVKHVRLKSDTVIHECVIEGILSTGDAVVCSVDWNWRYFNMRVHSAGHVVHEAVHALYSNLTPVKGEHGNKPYIEYEGSLTIDKMYEIGQKANEIVALDVPMKTELVSLDELLKRASWVPPHLPKNKPLRILTVGDYPPIPDGGTQVNRTGEVGEIAITHIENADGHVRVYYKIASQIQEKTENIPQATLSSAELTGQLLDVQREILEKIAESDYSDELKFKVLGSKSDFISISKKITHVPAADRQSVGIVINQVKQAITQALNDKLTARDAQSQNEWFDKTMPGIRPPEGHLHIVTHAIMEITRIFERIGFTRVRHPEVDWDWYPFESLNMPQNHPARDEWETFFIEYPGKPSKDLKKQKMVLTPHTSNGQVREMEKGKLPIRMINIAKCYRRQIDVSHVPMFHQFEGLYIDKNVSIAHLKGVFDYFAGAFFGPERKTRLRPFHFQFTEPSFEVDITCGICNGTGVLLHGEKCRLCKSGWLELGGSGMVHPTVLRNGGIDPDVYSGFAFGWGIERTYMMKSGTQLDDIRLLYGNDTRFLQQF